MKRIIDKTVNLELLGVNGNAFMIMGVFQRQAKREGWTKNEIDAVLSEAKSKDYDHLLATIINHCEVKDLEQIDPKEVWEVLQQLGLHTHYLASKATAFWDEYDHSNYRSLCIKAGKLKRVYGIYDIDIQQDEIHKVTSPPKVFYLTPQEATDAMQQLIDAGTFKVNELHILSLYKAIK